MDVAGVVLASPVLKRHILHLAPWMLQDAKQGMHWHERAAEQGNAEAQNTLGVHYAFGLGVPRDFRMAARWCMKAAAQGFHNAQHTANWCQEQLLVQAGKLAPKDGRLLAVVSLSSQSLKSCFCRCPYSNFQITFAYPPSRILIRCEGNSECVADFSTLDFRSDFNNHPASMFVHFL